MVEAHTGARFARLRETTPGSTSVAQRFPHPAAVSRFLYNLVFWVFLLPLVMDIPYAVVFVTYAVVLAVRAAINLWQNNGMEQTPEAYDRQWMRFPVT